MPKMLGRLEQRGDNTKEKVKVRMWQFHANVKVVRGSYINITVEVDGTQRLEDVSAMILKTFDAVLASMEVKKSKWCQMGEIGMVGIFHEIQTGWQEFYFWVSLTDNNQCQSSVLLLHSFLSICILVVLLVLVTTYSLLRMYFQSFIWVQGSISLNPDFAVLVIETNVMNAEKIALETQTNEQLLAAYSLKQEERDQRDAEFEQEHSRRVERDALNQEE